ncbi:MAG: hypothetical protein IJD40_04025 [Lachnospiraceae bacterium]|nr:hypothetical protein [Lachnospiraceae bacterium]
MVSIMNEYVAKIQLQSDDMTKNLLNAALLDCPNIIEKSIILKGNRYIVDIKLSSYSIEVAIAVMNRFMERSRYHYSSYFIRFNEGSMVRYRYASCKENREGFYCDVMIR